MAPRILLGALAGGGIGLSFGLLLGLQRAAPYLTILTLAAVIAGGVGFTLRSQPAERKWPFSILTGLACLLTMAFWHEIVPSFAALAGIVLACVPAMRTYAVLQSAEKSVKRAAVVLPAITVLAGGWLSLLASLRAGPLPAMLWMGSAGLVFGLLEGMMASADRHTLKESEIENILYAGVTLALGAICFGILSLNRPGSAAMTGTAGFLGLSSPAAFTDLHFTSNRDGSRQIYRQSAESGEVLRVTTPEKGECWMPRTGSNGDLYATCDRGTGRQVFRQDPETGAFIQMTQPVNGECWGPALGPGDNTFFTCNRNGKRAIYYQERSTGGVVRMTNPALGESWDPALGPNGELYFTSDREGSSQIYRLSIETGQPLRVTSPANGTCWSPTLGPDGDLYMTCDRGMGRQIYRISHETGIVDRITRPDSGENWGPVLGPNNNIHFTSNRSGKRQVYRIDHLTGEVMRMTQPTSGENWTVDEK